MESRVEEPRVQHDDEEDDDIMEIDNDDSLGVENSGGSECSNGTASSVNIVTIDDPNTLQKLANSKGNNSSNTLLLNVKNPATASAMSGGCGAGVTITPAKSRGSESIKSSLNDGQQALTSSASVTIRQASKATSGGNASDNGVNTAGAFGYDQYGQLNDPNLTDDTFVVEAPSFIVPYVYEKPPKETFKCFQRSVKGMAKKMRVEEKERRKKEKEERKAQKKKRRRDEDKDYSEDNDDEDEDDEDEEEDEEDNEEEDEDDDKSTKKNGDGSNNDDDIVIVKRDGDDLSAASKKSSNENFFESSLGKFMIDLGMSLVQETVQADLLKQQIRKSQKDKSAAVMHAIMSLRKNLETSKSQNEPFKAEEIKCKFCSFRTTSQLVLQHHLEVPHMRQGMYRCNFCRFEVKQAQEILGHMKEVHDARGRLERGLTAHQCPQCPYEDNVKGRLTRHKTSCDKRFRPERNQEPPSDWEPPAKIPKPAVIRRPNVMNSSSFSQLNRFQQHNRGQSQGFLSSMPQLQFGPGRMRGNNASPFRMTQHQRMHQGTSSSIAQQFGFNRQNLGSAMFSKGNASVMQALKRQQQHLGSSTGFGGQNRNVLPNLASNSSVTIQSVKNRMAQRGGGFGRANLAHSGLKPSISITPLNRNQSSLNNRTLQRPGQNMGGQGDESSGNKPKFVICEICDGYIKNMEQLRNHMLWVHKVKIHPKMIYNRPPLNCQKCQFRFFTDQGLERHLLGQHGLVTATMQEQKNRGEDSGRCPVCGKVFQKQLLDHVEKEHNKTLKPAHLSYKCTVCTATFGTYKLFEEHVINVHSGASKNKKDGSNRGSSNNNCKVTPQQSSTTTKQSMSLSSSVSIIPKPAAKNAQPPSINKSKTASGADVTSSSSKEPDIIDLDDEEEEIDDVEDDATKRRRDGKGSPIIGRNGLTSSSNVDQEDNDDDDNGVEEVPADDDDD